ncbi:MAG: hypothetical protein GWO03_15960, partial [Gammaproteobacteria bacterium]|nr:hypothetical protein [Gammaproteobacteria bacterium]
MNWKRRALTVLLGKVVLFGATAGVWGTVLLESARLVTRGGADPTAASALEGAALGLALAVLLA